MNADAGRSFQSECNTAIIHHSTFYILAFFLALALLPNDGLNEPLRQKYYHSQKLLKEEVGYIPSSSSHLLRFLFLSAVGGTYTNQFKRQGQNWPSTASYSDTVTWKIIPFSSIMTVIELLVRGVVSSSTPVNILSS